MNALLSVIVPVYRVEAYLDECVQSIVNQTYKNLEIILVDDGSPDNCPQMCDEWAKKDNRIKVIHQENKGPAETRKNGIAASKGEYLCFVDSDDYIELNMCEQVIAVFEKNDVEIVDFDWDVISAPGAKLPPPEKITEGILSSKDALSELVKGNINNYFVNKIYKRHVFEGVDFLNQRLWEDMGVMYNVFLNAKNVYCLPKKFYYYRMRSGSTINTISEKALEDIFYVQTKRYNDLLSIYPDIAEIAFRRIPWAAIRLYDRSLWKKVDGESLKKAIEFLTENKDKILALGDKKRFIGFYKSRRLYNLVRLLIHKIGNVIKKFR